MTSSSSAVVSVNSTLLSQHAWRPHESKVSGFNGAAPEDQDAIAHYYGYHGDFLRDIMHGLRTDPVFECSIKTQVLADNDACAVPMRTLFLHTDTDNMPTPSKARLLLGAGADAAYWPFMKENRVKFVLNLAAELAEAIKRNEGADGSTGIGPFATKGVTYRHFHWYDSADQARSLIQKQRFTQLREATRFIHDALTEIANGWGNDLDPNSGSTRTPQNKILNTNNPIFWRKNIEPFLC